jgi:hypothetical protein
MGRTKEIRKRNKRNQNANSSSEHVDRAHYYLVEMVAQTGRIKLLSSVQPDTFGMNFENSSNTIELKSEKLERVTRLELASSAWKAEVLALELHPLRAAHHSAKIARFEDLKSTF